MVVANETVEAPIEVELPSGTLTHVATAGEAEFVEAAASRYLEVFSFDNPSDISDLDLIITMEMLCWRWNDQLGKGVDHRGLPVVPKQLQDFVKSYSIEIRQLKAQLGMDKKTRERTTGDGSMAEFADRLRQAGGSMNLLRCRQLNEGIELSMQLRTLVTVYWNGDDEERTIFHCTAEDIMVWIRDVFDPRMQAIDDYFRSHEAAIFSRKL